MLRALIFAVVNLLYCNCDQNVERIYESGTITPGFIKVLQNSNVSNNTCAMDVFYTIDAALRSEKWALKMIDASAKIQSGYLEGNVFNLGSYSECLSVKGTTTSNREIIGKYCLAFIFLTNMQRSNMTYALTHDLRRILNNNPGIPILCAICLPDSCTAKDINYLVNTTLISDNAPVKIVFDQGFCTSNENHYEFTILHWITLVIFIATLIFMLLSTMYDLYLMKFNLEPRHNILISYSIYRNLKNLYRVREDPDQLTCINGIRTLSMMWVILGHKYLMTAPIPHNNYLYVFQQWLKQTSSAFIIGAMFSVDTFFLISGLLIVYVVLLAKEKQIDFSLIHYYLHRLFRLSPAFFMVILYYLTFLKHSSSGPFWSIPSKHFVEACENNWWYSMLYIQNLLELDDVCVNQSWYLATDTQLYSLAPLLFLPLQRWPKQTIIVANILSALSCFFGFYITWVTKINGKITDFSKEFRILYSSIVYRCSSWLLGTLLGYYLFIKRGKKMRINKIFVSIFWTLSVFTMLSMVLMKEYFYQYEYNIWVTSIYYGFSKTLWSVSLCWIIFACVHGYGGIINRFLSMKLFMVLGRLTYSMYIVHVAYLTVSTYGGETNTIFKNSSILYEYISDFVLVIIISHIWTLAFESPLISIGKIMMPIEMSKKLTAIHETNENINESNSTSL